MKSILTLTTLSQLKALSVPIRAEIMMRLIEKPLTGQMLSEKLNLSRPKVHYHLKELEKNHLITLVKTEEKGGIIQKFYQSVARGFTPSLELLPHMEDVNESNRQLLFQMAEKTKQVILSAPEHAFTPQRASESPADWNHVGSMWQISVTEEQFNDWMKKYFELMEELRHLSKEPSEETAQKLYFFSTMAFEVDELIMETIEHEDEENKA
ncbi:ArsR family transcriptional regulator [Exiguobacterium sp. s193]|uniref:ArsR/SmtB family transcription factor n=1 Tax=Exiguobacterium sp. s193 TaxID=2751207 RepID=UPI001BEB1C64|nr:ArsR family transcriptional regulator [Exiguobacterium sp. s193]